MSRLVSIGAGGGEVSWHDALKDLRADDVLLLEPGFYELPKGTVFANITLKGTGGLPEDTTILGSIDIAIDSQFVNLENLCVNTNTDSNSLFIPPEANTYLTLRNCLIKGCGTDTAAVAVNGKVTVELYSIVVLNGSVSIYADADFRLEMNDSTIEYVAEDFGALALEGHGTAIINNSKIVGSIDTFTKSNAELDFNNSVADSMLLQGQVWLNMLNSNLLSEDDSCMYITEETWINIVGSYFNGGIYIDQKPHVIIQSSQISRLIAVNDAAITITNSVIVNHADFQDNVKCTARRTTFNGGAEYQYFLALSDHALLKGYDLIFNSNNADLAVKDWAQMQASIIASSDASITVECGHEANIRLLGMKWTTKKK